MTATAFLELKQRAAKLSERERRSLSAYLIRLGQDRAGWKRETARRLNAMAEGKKSAWLSCGSNWAMPDGARLRNGSAGPGCRMSRTIRRWAVFTDTVCEGRIPAYHDEAGWPVTYATPEAAWREIADDLITHLERFVRGELALEETDFAAPDYVLPVTVAPDGTICTGEGERIGRRE